MIFGSKILILIIIIIVIYIAYRLLLKRSNILNKISNNNNNNNNQLTEGYTSFTEGYGRFTEGFELNNPYDFTAWFMSSTPESELNKINHANKYLSNKFHLETSLLTNKEIAKRPFRYDVINFLIAKIGRPCSYLEIGVRNKKDNFDLITAEEKYSVDPGFEAKINDVNFEMTSDLFFDCLKKNSILFSDIRFDIIFIDGSHLADQVARDIENALFYLSDDGFVVMHDCNPPTEFHASENYNYRLSPSGGSWNGTTWKAFINARKRTDISGCCIDSDWGIGIISKSKSLGSPNSIQNEFYEHNIFDRNRYESLNLMSFEDCFQIKFLNN